MNATWTYPWNLPGTVVNQGFSARDEGWNTLTIQFMDNIKHFRDAEAAMSVAWVAKAHDSVLGFEVVGHFSGVWQSPSLDPGSLNRAVIRSRRFSGPFKVIYDLGSRSSLDYPTQLKIAYLSSLDLARPGQHPINEVQASHADKYLFLKLQRAHLIL